MANITGTNQSETLFGTADADVIDGQGGNDIILGQDGDDDLRGGEGNDVLLGGANNDTLDGGEGNDVLNGDSGIDSLNGGGGDDQLSVTPSGAGEYADGGSGVDYLNFFAGFHNAGVTFSLANSATPQIVAGATLLNFEWMRFGGSDFADHITGGALNDLIEGRDGDDVIDGGGGNDNLQGGQGANIVYGGDGDDTIVSVGSDQLLDGGPGVDLLSVTISAWHGTLDLSDPSVDQQFGGITVRNIERLNFRADFGGPNIITGGAYDDIIVAADGDDILSGGGGNDDITGGGGVDELYGGAGDDYLRNNELNNLLGFSVADGGDGYDQFMLFVDNFTGAVAIDLNSASGSVRNIERIDFRGGSGINTIIGAAAADWMRGGNNHDYFEGRGGNDDIGGGGGNDIIYGGAGSDYLDGGSGADTIYGGDDDDVLSGGEGDDIIEGGAGNDTLYGGSGNGDTAVYSGNRADYSIGTSGQVTVRDLNAANGDEGTDTLDGIEFIRFADVTVQMGIDPNNPPQLGQPAMADQSWADSAPHSYTIPGTAFFDLDEGDTLTFQASLSNGAALPSWLSFDPATRTFSGTPPVGQIGVTLEIRVTASDGDAPPISDDFLIAVTQASGADVIGTPGPDVLAGTFRNETLIGLDGDDRLLGSAGADRLDGGAGTDEADYSASPQAVTIDLDAGHGFGSGGDAEGDELISLERYTGSAFDDRMVAASGINTFDGRAGADYLQGGIFGDLLIGGEGADTLLGGDGADTLKANARPDGALEDIVDGGAGNDTLDLGGSAHRVLLDLSNPASGATSVEVVIGTRFDDVLTGIGGPDRFYGGDGADTLSGGGETDYLYGEAGDDNLFGGGGSDLLDGGLGNDYLDAGAAADTMAGGAGDDTYIVDDSGDTVVENEGGGTDEVRTALATFSLVGLTPVENLTGTSNGGQALTGNGLSNFILGGSGDDLIDGGAGADVLRGALGNDIYVVDDAGDNVDEVADGGTDEIRTSLAAFSLFALPNFENLTGTSASGQILEGNARSNFILGGSGDDLIDGGAGADVLRGALGNDIYIVDDTGDNLDEVPSGGTDEVRTALASFSLAGLASLANFENLTGLGSGDQTFIGNGLGNVIDGGLGADAMAGGLGNDMYVVDNAGDSVTELAGEGTDEIRTGLGLYSLFGLANVENLTATSNINHDFRGNGGNNVITGGAGNDTFRMQDGGTDSAIGGGGNDFFLFGASLDTLDGVDGGAGIDQIAIQGNYNITLGSGLVNIESLIPLPGNDVRFGDSGTNFYDYVLRTVDANVGAGQRLTVDANRLRAGEDFTFDGSAETDGELFLIGGGGVDTLTGGAKNDTFLFGENNQFGAGDTVNGGSGGANDQLGLRGDYTIAFGANQLVGIESIALVSSQDTRFGGRGLLFNYNLTMNDANVAAGQLMTVDGAPLRPNETLTFNGSAESDGSYRVAGGSGADTITGGAQGDILIGRAGGDMLRGGGGNDLFRIDATGESNAAGRDQILDFTSGDRIDLSRMDAIAGTPANDAFTFIGNAAFGNHAGELRFENQSGNIWLIQGDADGNGIADFEVSVTIDDLHPITAADFIL